MWKIEPLCECTDFDCACPAPLPSLPALPKRGSAVPGVGGRGYPTPRRRPRHCAPHRGRDVRQRRRRVVPERVLKHGVRRVVKRRHRRRVAVPVPVLPALERIAYRGERRLFREARVRRRDRRLRGVGERRPGLAGEPRRHRASRVRRRRRVPPARARKSSSRWTGRRLLASSSRSASPASPQTTPRPRTHQMPSGQTASALRSRHRHRNLCVVRHN